MGYAVELVQVQNTDWDLLIIYEQVDHDGDFAYDFVKVEYRGPQMILSVIGEQQTLFWQRGLLMSPAPKITTGTYEFQSDCVVTEDGLILDLQDQSVYDMDQSDHRWIG